MAAESSRRGALVLPFHRPARDPIDAARNDEWDRLLRLAREAWEWRDPDSLEALGACLEQLRGCILREWSA